VQNSTDRKARLRARVGSPSLIVEAALISNSQTLATATASGERHPHTIEKMDRLSARRFMLDGKLVALDGYGQTSRGWRCLLQLVRRSIGAAVSDRLLPAILKFVQ